MKSNTTKTSKKKSSKKLSASVETASDTPHRLVPNAKTSKKTLHVVGIGASAGGLEALEIFLAHVPENSDMAFIIVQHLDPTHKGVMVELLQRSTTMPVIQVRDKTRVKPNCVYVIPPNKDMSILRNVLYLLDPVAPRGLRLPIDFFFRTMAEDQLDRSIGVILSGMGSDGTLGLRAIKEKAGVVFVQEPSNARFDGMPRSAIEAGLADVIDIVETLPEKIYAYINHTPLITGSGIVKEAKTQSELDKVVIILRMQTGHDFSLYKKTTIYRRIERRMGIHKFDKIAEYVRFLQSNANEVELLFRELLIGVTSFFRDPDAWELMKTKVLAPLITAQSPNQVLRAWVPACSTGEEAYSLAIIFKEVVEEIKPNSNINLQIFATDLDQQAIEKARDGIFPANISADVSQKRLRRFFVQTERGYQASKTIREMVIFAPQNIIMDPPFTKLHILSCRNLLIYLTPELQKKILPLFHYSLCPGGFLFLGSSETIGSFLSMFESVDNKSRIYKRLDTGLQTAPAEFPLVHISRPSETSKPVKSTINIQSLAEQILLQNFSPAAVLTTDQGDILFINGHTGKYLEPAAGKANWNIFAMAREGLRYELHKAFQKSLRQQETVTLHNILIGINGGTQLMNVIIQPIRDSEPLRGMMMIVFHDVALVPKLPKQVRSGRIPTRSAQIAGLEREVNIAKQEVQTIREEMQSSQEELKSANEELQSTNEELQSTNEEITTSKEEMQSMNEELQTINHELQAKVDELSRINNDMKNLLDSTNIATLFLDSALNVRRFTNATSKITRLLPGDEGRPVTDIASSLLYAELADDAQEVLRTLVSMEKQIQTGNGNWFVARILPYRTLENMIDGVVITFTEITDAKKLEAELRSTEKQLRELLPKNVS